MSILRLWWCQVCRSLKKGVRGDLTQKPFTLKGVDFEIDELTSRYVTHLPKLWFISFTANQGSGADDWILQIGSRSFRLGDRVRFNSRDFTYAWDGHSLGWNASNAGDKVTVSLWKPPTPPAVESATVSGTSLAVYFDQTLAADANLANTAFTVKKTPPGGSETTMSLTGTPSVSSMGVALTLGSAVAPGDAVTVSYTNPPSGSNNRLLGTNGRAVVSFTGRSVTNVTPQRSIVQVTVNEGSEKSINIRPLGSPTAGHPATLKLKFRPGTNKSGVSIKTGTATATSTAAVTFKVTGDQDADWQDGYASLWVLQDQAGHNTLPLAEVWVRVVDDDRLGPGVTNGCSAAPSGPIWSTCMGVGSSGNYKGYMKESRDPLTGGFSGGFGGLEDTTVTASPEIEIDAIVNDGGRLTVSFAADPRPVSDGWVIRLGTKAFNFSDGYFRAPPRPGAPSAATFWSYTFGGSLGWSANDKVTVSVFNIDKPSGVSATAGDRQATLSWTAVTGATDYEVRVCKGSAVTCETNNIFGQGPYAPPVATGSTSASYTVTHEFGKSNDIDGGKLQNGVRYSLQVRAVTANGKSGWSDEVEFTPIGTLQVGAAPAPRIVAMTPGGQEATLAWEIDEAVKGITAWRLRYGAVNLRNGTVDWGAWADIPGAGGDARSHTVTGLSPSISYAFELRAMVGALEGHASLPYLFLEGVLPAVTGLTAASADRQVALVWTVPSLSTAIGSWQVRRKAAGAASWGAWTDIAGSGAATAAHTVTGLENQTRYAFEVRALSAASIALAQSGAAEAWAGSAPPPGQPELRATPGDREVTLAWTVPESVEPITGWQLRHGEMPAGDGDPDWGEWAAIADATADTVEHTVSGLENGTEYAFELRAMAGELAGVSSATKVVTAGVPLPTLSVDNASVDEGDSGTRNLTFTVTLSPASGREVTVEVATARFDGDVFASTDDSQPGGPDYQPIVARTLTFAPGETEKTVDVAVNGDRTDEPGFERFRLVLSDAVNAVVEEDPGTGIGYIMDDDDGEPLSADLAGSVPDSATSGGQSGDGCRVDVAVRFVDGDGEAVAVDALAASDFTVENGRVGAPVVDADGLGWSVPAWAAQGFTGLMRVRLAETEQWNAGEQVFRVASDSDCAPATRSELASLSLGGLALDPAFAHATTAYTAAADAETGQATVSAAAVYGTAAVSISPADADAETDGHQVALAQGENTVTVMVTPADTDVAAQEYTVTVTRAAADPDGTRAGAVSLGAQSPAKGRQFFRGKSLDRANGDKVDYYSFTTDGRYALGLGVRDQSVELAVTLEDADGNAVGTAGPPKDTTKDQLYIEWLAQTIEPGTYYVRVEALADGATDYYIRLGLADAPAQAVTDADGTRAGAVALDIEGATQGAKYYRDYTLDRADGDRVDYYSFTTSARHALGLGVRGQSVELKVVLEDANGAAVGIAGPPKDPNKEQVYIEWLAQTIDAGTYYIRVEALEDGATTYYLRFGLTAPPPELSVADASAKEGTDATLDFAVTLDKSWSKKVTVAYATADGTAVAGEDYTATSGTLTFAAGETSKTVSVPVLDDAIDEGSETLTLTLSNARGAEIADGEATGTITNSDPIPQAWLARFGRTVTGQVLEAVEARLAAPRAAGAEASLAGQALPSWSGDAVAANDNGSGLKRRAEEEDRAALASMTAWLAQADPGARGTAGFGAHDDGGARFETRALTQRDLIVGTSFALTGGSSEGGGFASLWGRASIAGFDGREGSLAVDGEVTTGLIGADWASDPGSGSGRWTAGLAIGHSTGTGGWHKGGDCAPNCGGAIDATLTGLYPYAGVDLTERLSLWAAAGHGSGEVTVTPEAPGGGNGTGLSADLSMSMGAAGMRSEVLRPEDGEGLALAVKGDARFTRTSSDAVRSDTGNLEASEADVWLVRTGIEGSRPVVLGESGVTLTPTFEVGVRLDGGDAETGMGADMGGGLVFADPANGLVFDVKARGLVAHESPGFREWGTSLSGSWDPRPESDRGLSLSLRQSWGASPAGGMDALLSRETLAGLAANDDGAGGDFKASSRLEGGFGYGLAVFGGAFTGTPNVGFGLSDGGARDWRVGWRLTSAVPGDPGFEVSLDATRREPANDDGPPEHGVTLRAAIRW